jgi:hypothetical protein
MAALSKAGQALEINPVAALGVLGSLMIGLIAVIYNSMDRRLEKCESGIEKIGELHADVKIIRASCPMCERRENDGK